MRPRPSEAPPLPRRGRSRGGPAGSRVRVRGRLRGSRGGRGPRGRGAMAGRAAALLVAVLGAGAAGLSLEPVVWHTGNRRFQDDGGYVLYPQIGDRLDLVCPGGAGYEYYKLYLVGGAQARRCQVQAPPGPAPPGPAPTLLLTCDRPQRDVRFTIKFQEFSPNLWGHEFRRQHDYYIITTSDGTPEGLENGQGGACLTRAMRVTLRVGQRECGPAPSPPCPSP
ncbi:ephrin-B3 [Ammospiza maritima maritima]